MADGRPDSGAEHEVVRGPFWTETKRGPFISEVKWDPDVTVLYVAPEEAESQEANKLLRQEGFDFQEVVASPSFREEFRCPMVFSPIGSFEGLERIRDFPQHADLMGYQTNRHQKNAP
jgi:hypothetical protein